MSVLVFISNKNEHNYQDKITNGVVKYVGQRYGKRDYIITDGIRENKVFKVYYRHRQNIPFTFLGETRNVSVLQQRTKKIGVKATDDELLQIELRVETIVNRKLQGRQFKRVAMEENGLSINTSLLSGIYNA